MKQENFSDVQEAVGALRLLRLRTEYPAREHTVAVLKALGSLPRMAILNFLERKVANVSEIAQALDMPLSTTNLHITALEEAGLIHSETVTASRGIQKLCARLYDAVVVFLPQSPPTSMKVSTIEMPVGAFYDCEVQPTCGLATAENLIGRLDDAASFFEPERIHAQLVWLTSGFLEYRFPYRHDPENPVHSLTLSAEICSEAAPYALEWPSDIFVEINGKLIGVWTSPGDFGGERGTLTPAWWGEWNSQYGLLKTWRVDASGSFIDGVKSSQVCIHDLELERRPYIAIRIGVKPDAINVGGMNLFGKRFGNYAQDLILKIIYTSKASVESDAASA
uniref:ArsR family transcriptional regulator n=1 Tax=Caldilinea aerophila TaxID=133453 RepID=A0A7C1FIB5_9CHLR